MPPTDKKLYKLIIIFCNSIYSNCCDISLLKQEMKEAAGPDEQELAQEMADAFLNEDLPENVFGAPKAGPGMWASVIRIMDPIEGKTLFLHRFEQNEAAVR
jgi:splicing factor 3B subunit 3